MDQYLDNRHKEILWRLLANPADTGQLYVTNLEQMVNDHPQSGLLRVLLERATDKHDVTNAAVYFKTSTLYKLLHGPDSFHIVAPDKIISDKASGAGNYFNVQVTEEDTHTDVADQQQEATSPFTEPEANVSQEPETIVVPRETESATAIDEEPQDEIQDIDTIIPELYNSHNTDESTVKEPAEVPQAITPEPFDSYTEELAEEKEEAQTPQAQEPATFTNLSADNGYREEKEYFRQDIEDEIYDEIVSIDDIGFEPTVNVLHEAEEKSNTVQNEGQNNYANEEDYPADEEDEDERPLPKLAGVTDRDIAIDEEKLILGNIVSADYLTFDKKLDELRNTDNFPRPASTETQEDTEPVKESHDTLSRYNDETMPYSFMWWLDKTRKEHAGSLQPYAVSPVAPQTVTEGSALNTFNNTETVKPVKRVAPDELQQQYYENIFSLTSVSGIEGNDEAKGVEFDHNKKEDIIIERFIHNEPQIRPPAADRLDNENKAKKSSEDQDALVTETLARIYIDQMLYHKAIATYKKLILKFPEKKLYFASQIEQLEKKTN
ncbi:hypothetical protein [Mucilaginibacter sp.]|uniref:hypothetical protein n=1 Tax=Mucilaginibacter sp. TaxID=1882438 RepID=UPI0035614F31